MKLRKGLLILLLALSGGSVVLWAQTPVLPASAAAAASASSSSAPGADTDAGAVQLLVGRSTVLDVGTTISRVSLTSASVADALVTTPSQLLINGKMPGTISMFVWDRAGALHRYEVVVQRDLAQLNTQMQELLPGEAIRAHSTGKNIVLSGSASSKDVMEKAVSLASGHVDKREEVVSLLTLQPSGASNQVLLRVRFAEVSRNALTELGASFAANGYNDGRWFGRTTTQQFAAPEWDSEGKFVFSDFLNLFLFDSKNQLAGVVKALQSKGLFQSLAEPNLVAESGKEASFLAGGEFPIPVVQGGATNAVTIMFKEFGIRLSFTPTVNGDRVHLKVRPEVSALDFSNAIVLEGFRIPALTSRKTETELELMNGQTFAIAGLMNNTMNSTMQKIPGIGDIPILGLLFKSKAAQKNQTELVVMITPEILPNNSRGVTPNLPKMPETFIDPIPKDKQKDMPPPAFGGRVSSGVSSTARMPAFPAPPAAVAPNAASGAAAQMPWVPSMPVDQAALSAPAPVPAPMTAADKKAVEQARKEAAERAEKQQKLAKEQARKDAEAAREKGKRDAEIARKQAEAERERQEALAEAQAKVKAAETAYNAAVQKAASEK